MNHPYVVLKKAMPRSGEFGLCRAILEVFYIQRREAAKILGSRGDLWGGPVFSRKLRGGTCPGGALSFAVSGEGGPVFCWLGRGGDLSRGWGCDLFGDVEVIVESFMMKF